MADKTGMSTDDNPMSALEPIGDVNIKLATSHGVAAIALSLAMKYYDINTVQDGMLYQQYKLEGKNMKPLHIDMVFDTAIKIERHLLASSDRIVAFVIDAVKDAVVEAAEDETGSE